MQYSQINPPWTKQYWQKLWLDLFFVLLIICVVYVLSSYFNISDNFFLWAKNYEDSLDIDELPIGLLAGLTALLWFSVRRIYESSILMKQNHALLQRLLEVQEIERKRIAQDLHDDLGQYLNAIKVQATSLINDETNSLDTRITARRISDTANYGYHAARQMIHSLRPVALDELGLATALEDLVDSWSKAQGEKHTITNYNINITGNIDQFCEQINIIVFRIVQEALTNIAKHANAKNAVINVNYSEPDLHITIKDDGVGFNVENSSFGYGLMGMLERTDTLDGKLNIESSYKGTTIMIKLNLNSSKSSMV